MKFKQPAFILMMLFIGFALTACAGPTKIVSAPSKEISLTPPLAMIIKENHIFAYETARCATTPQFLITSAHYSLLPPDKALKINLQVLIPKEFAPPESPHAFSVFFPKGSHSLDDKATKDLDRFIHDLKEDQTRPVNVAGYTCRLGSDDYNQKLAMNRARAVADYLDRHGVSVASVTSKSGGGYISDTNPAQNRRVEITLSPAADQPITINQKGGVPEIEP